MYEFSFAISCYMLTSQHADCWGGFSTGAVDADCIDKPVDLAGASSDPGSDPVSRCGEQQNQWGPFIWRRILLLNWVSGAWTGFLSPHCMIA